MNRLLVYIFDEDTDKLLKKVYLKEKMLTEIKRIYETGRETIIYKHKKYGYIARIFDILNTPIPARNLVFYEREFYGLL